MNDILLGTILGIILFLAVVFVVPKIFPSELDSLTDDSNKI